MHAAFRHTMTLYDLKSITLCHCSILTKNVQFYDLQMYTRALQPVATCRQSAYLHKTAIIIMTSFSLWCYSLLSWPRPAWRTNVHTDILPRLIY